MHDKVAVTNNSKPNTIAIHAVVEQWFSVLNSFTRETRQCDLRIQSSHI